MKHKIYYKNIWRTIRGSLGRYIAIMAIVALGVGFFAGVKVTKASMVETADSYTSSHNMYDFKLVSTLGFTHEEVEKMGKENGVDLAEGSITLDFFSKDSRGNSVIYKAHSITDKVNTLRLTEGRLPESSRECVGDKEHFSSEDIGREIEVTGENSRETREDFKYGKYRLVGLVDTPVYMNRTERGTASIGDGTVNAYVYMPEESFNCEYYTEMYLTVRNGGYMYSDEYNRSIEKVKPGIEDAAQKCGMERYDEIVSDAKKKLSEAREELSRGKQELQDGRNELSSKKEETYSRLRSSKENLDTAGEKLDAAETQLETRQAELTSNLKSLKQAEGQASTAYEAAKSAYEAAYEAAESGGEDPESSEAVLEAREQMKAAEAALDTVQGNLKTVNGALEQVEAGFASLQSRRAEIKSGYREYRKGKEKAEEEFAKAEARLSEAEEELRAGEREIEKSERELKDLEEPELYVQTRDDNQGYESFNSNSDIVDSIAKVFPVFFFLIAALVCSTTMSRMIEEERTQIGALRAIGYSRRRIMLKYIIYSGSAAAIGCIMGFLLGSKLFPLAIWLAYNMIFDFSPLTFYFSWPLAGVSLFVAFLCSAGTTYLACRRQLREMPAEILRPRAPKAGKRVFLEKIDCLWSRLRFLHKVAARNILRYKKRMIMMIMGIAGCTALVLAGFGIFDSVAGMADHQYEEIEKYDMTVQFDGELHDKTAEEFAGDIGGISVMVPVQRTTVTAKSPDKIRSCDMMITDKPSRLKKIINFREGSTEGPELDYPDTGEALINNKLAELMGVKKGDMLTVEYDDTKRVELKVSGIYRNYVGNYIYINTETYDKLMNKSYKPELALIRLAEGDAEKTVKAINENSRVLGLKLNSDTRKTVDSMMISLNYIVWLVVACAGALAFIVLFNLGNINITERTREIATIKVLGFYPAETGSYVFRENIVLIVLGIVAGLPTGFALHKFIMKQIAVDAIAFNETVEPRSYFFAAAMVILFSVVTDIILRKKLKKIHMAEALKSIE
ncbi:MAG: FtsX-like permease family protein [Lentihominibacter sp.]